MEHNAAPAWKPDAALSRVLDAAKARALREGRALLTAGDIERAIDNVATAWVPEAIPVASAGRVRLDETARQLLRANGEDGTVTAAEVRARLLRGRWHCPLPFDTVEDWLLAELRAWRLMAAAAEVQYGSASFCPPGERKVDPDRAEAMRAEARRQIQAIGERLAVTDWHPRRNPLAQLTTEHGLLRLTTKCLLVLYLHHEFGIWAVRGAPVEFADLARTVVETVGETDLVSQAVERLAEARLAAVVTDARESMAIRAAPACQGAFRTAAGGDCPRWIVRAGSRSRFE